MVRTIPSWRRPLRDWGEVAGIAAILVVALLVSPYLLGVIICILIAFLIEKAKWLQKRVERLEDGSYFVDRRRGECRAETPKP